MSEVPPTPPTPPTPAPAPAPAPVDPAEAVKMPGMILMILGGLSVLARICWILYRLIFVGLAVAAGGGGVGTFVSGGVGILFMVLAIACDGVIAFGGMKMQKLQSYNLCLLASGLAIIPCISPCCIVGIPFGIWAIIVLMKPEVKAAFTQGTPAA